MAEQPMNRFIYITRLSQAEKAGVYVLDKVWPDAELGRRFRSDVSEVVIDRLVLAYGLFDVAKSLMQPHPGSIRSEVELRCSVSRAYYAIHHAIRAICLYKDKWDPDGHSESISRFKSILGDADFGRITGLDMEVIDAIRQAQDNRQVADYSPYDSTRVPDTIPIKPILITESDWQAAAEFNILLADRLLNAATKFDFD